MVFRKGCHKSLLNFAFSLTQDLVENCPRSAPRLALPSDYVTAQQEPRQPLRSPLTAGLSSGAWFSAPLTSAAINVCAHSASRNDVLFLWDRLHSFYSNICHILSIKAVTQHSAPATRGGRSSRTLSSDRVTAVFNCFQRERLSETFDSVKKQLFTEGFTIYREKKNS